MSSEKYSRQELFLGKQEKLSAAKVVIVGVGALGTVAAELLVRAGVGEIVLVDFDGVEESNLQRQSLFTEKDVGKNKALAAAERLREINSLVQIKFYPVRLEEGNLNLLDHADVVLGCTDDLESRFLINKYCVKKNIPWVYGAAVKAQGYAMAIVPDGPCLNCFLKKAVDLDNACTVGVLNTITYAIPALQVQLVLDILIGREVKAELYYLDLWQKEFKKLKVKKDAGCEICRK